MDFPTSSIDLRKYSEQVRLQITEVQDKLLSQYIAAQSNLGGLYHEVSRTTQTLSRLEDLLSNFQNDLSEIGTEIKFLQEQSLAMTMSVANRKSLGGSLQNYLKQVMLAPELITAIANNPVDEHYIKHVTVLRDKLRYFRTEGTLHTTDGDISSLSMKEILPELKRLNHKAAFRIRSFLLTQFQALTRPKTNIQMLQENVLLKYKELLLFLRENNQDVFVELCMSYTDIMSGIYLSHFRLYFSSLKRLVLDTATKSDLIVIEESRGLFSTVEMTPKVASFDLHDRHLILSRLEECDPIVSHSAQKAGEKHSLERVFQSLLRLLVDTCSFAYVFALDFFVIKPEQYDAVFGGVFEKTFAHVQEVLGQLVANSYDIVSILLMIRINEGYKVVMEKRQIAFMGVFFDRVKMILWPRFQWLFDVNIRSVELAKPVSVHNVSPHTITTRFAQLVTVLSKVGPEDDMFRHRLVLLKKHMLNLLEKMALHFRDEKNRCVFLINNFDYILEEFAKDAADGGLFETAYRGSVEQYIELQLAEVFGMLLDFMSRKKRGTAIDQRQVEILLSDFRANWKKGVGLIQMIEKDLFSGENCAKEVLKETYTRLVMYYSECCDIIKADFPNFARDLVPVHHVMQEIQPK